MRRVLTFAIVLQSFLFAKITIPNIDWNKMICGFSDVDVFGGYCSEVRFAK